MTSWLKEEWYELALKYIEDQEIVDRFWQDIVSSYLKKSRHYHNLSHIHDMLVEAKSIETSIVNFDDLRFAIWYHDVVYEATRNDNEKRSAVFAKKCLKSSNVEEKRLKNIEKLIVSTQKHQILVAKNDDNAYLLDLDLSILGTDWDTYEKYTQDIRKEYIIYPNFIYKKGRKKVLHHFLERETLFFSTYFKNRFETQARTNIKREIDLL